MSCSCLSGLDINKSPFIHIHNKLIRAGFKNFYKTQKEANAHSADEVKKKTVNDPPDVVERLCLVHHDAACWTPVATKEMLHDTAFTNL